MIFCSYTFLKLHQSNINIALTFLSLIISVLGLSLNTAQGSETSDYEGLIEPYELVEVGSPVEGVVEKINVQRSGSVQKGDPLVLLESSVESAVVERARALAATEGELKLQEERLAYSRKIYARVKELFENEAISAEKMDEAASEVSQALARLQKARENRHLAVLDLEQAQAMLDRRTIKSPISGVVVERYVSPGEFVDSQPLLKLAQMDPLKVEVILPATLFAKIKPGMQAEIIPEIQAGRPLRATVSIVDKVMDPASGTFGVRLALPNPDNHLPGGLRCSVRFLETMVKTEPSSMENKELAARNTGTKQVYKLSPLAVK